MATTQAKKRAPQGLDPYDTCYGVSYTKGDYVPSPFERTEKLKERLNTSTYYVHSERGLLLTEAYKQYDADPQNIKMAKAIRDVMLKTKIDIYPDELIVGEIGTPDMHGPLYPEFSYDWIIDEMHNAPFEEREYDRYYYKDPERVKQEMDSIAPYWKGRTVQDAIEAMMTEDEKKGTELEKLVYQLSLYHYGGVGHYVIDYPYLLTNGYGQIKKDIEEKLEALDATIPENIEKHNFYWAELIAVQAVIDWIRRYAVLAAEMAEKESDSARKQELERISANCMQVSEGPARDFWEALQLVHFATDTLLMESNGHSVSYGRFDQYLNPFYEQDMEKEMYPKAFIEELMESWFMKVCSILKLRDRITTDSNIGGGWGGESLTIGGVNEDGEDVSNDLSMMVLEATQHIRIGVPWICARWHPDAPREYKVKVANICRAGAYSPKVYNDETAIPAAMAKGRTLEEARNYAVVGCVEIDTAGYEYGWHDASYTNIAKILELAINNGRCVGCGSACPRFDKCAGAGKRLGIDTGSLRDFTSFDQVLEAYEAQLKYWLDLMVTGIEIMDICHQKLKPLPYLSLVMNDCVEKGKDITCGGARYNHTGPQAAGIATTGDSLSAIKQLIFDEKRITGDELLDALEHNWVGHEPLHALVNSSKVHHYGNDDDYADELTKFVFDTYCKHIEGRPNARGGTYTPGVYTVSANVALSFTMGPSCDGRKFGEPLSDNMGPVHTTAGSHDIMGHSAVVMSATKMDHTRATNGTLMNWKINPECVSGDTGLDNLINLIDVYFKKGGMHSQFNVMSNDMLKDAMAHPEDYADLMVRVAGFCSIFVLLNEPLQLDIIGRTEGSFE